MFNKNDCLEILKNVKYDIYSAMKSVENTNYFEYIYLKNVAYQLGKLNNLILKEKDELNKTAETDSTVELSSADYEDLEK